MLKDLLLAMSEDTINKARFDVYAVHTGGDVQQYAKGVCFDDIIEYNINTMRITGIYARENRLQIVVTIA